MGNLVEAIEHFNLNQDETLSPNAGPTLRRKNRSAESIRRMQHAATLLEAAWDGSPRARNAVSEALSTDDLFKSAAGDVMDIALLAAYNQTEKQWPKFAAKQIVKDFRKKYLRTMDGASQRLELVPELTEYPDAGYSASETAISVAKYGRQFGYSWESAINDQLDELRLVPAKFGRAAALTEDWNALKQLADPVTGAPNPLFFNVGNANLGTGMLTGARLQAAWVWATSRRDSNGNLLLAPRLNLIVGKAMAFTAMRLINATELRTVDGSGNTIIEANPFTGLVDLVVLDNLPGNAWFLIPAPNTERPATYVAFLRGYETPDIRWKADQGRPTGGGQYDVDSGDFIKDSCYWRVRHVNGSAMGDPKMAYASDGVGA